MSENENESPRNKPNPPSHRSPIAFGHRRVAFVLPAQLEMERH